MMLNNPMLQVVAAMRSGGDPMAMLNQMAQSNPQMQQAMRMISGKNQQQLQEMAKNLARERGINIEDVARSLGISIPSQR